MFCYECHEELLHNPVLLSKDVERFRELVLVRGISEKKKPAGRAKIAARVVLFHDVIARGLRALHEEEMERTRSRGAKGEPS